MIMIVTLLPTQLFELPTDWDITILMEPFYLHERHHPLKRVHLLACIWEYTKKNNATIVEDIDGYLRETKDIHMFYPIDKQMVSKYGQVTQFMDTPAYIISVGDHNLFFSKTHSTFYKKARIALSILVDNGNPLGGKWSYDVENRKTFPKEYSEPARIQYTSDNIKRAYKKVKQDCPYQWVYEYSKIPYATTREQAVKQMKAWIRTELPLFGDTQDAMRSDVTWGTHSALSVYMNVGLLTPREILDEVSAVYSSKRFSTWKKHIASVEGFVRQIFWREYIRMHYEVIGIPTMTYIKSNNSMPSGWYNAKTPLEYVNNCILKIHRHAYVSHIERLMLLLNAAILSGIKARDLANWFNFMFIDGAEHLMLNVHMATISFHPDRFMTRSYLHSGAYLENMGIKLSKQDKEKTKQLLHAFVEKNKQVVSKDFRLSRLI